MLRIYHTLLGALTSFTLETRLWQATHFLLAISSCGCRMKARFLFFFSSSSFFFLLLQVVPIISTHKDVTGVISGLQDIHMHDIKPSKMTSEANY